MKTSLLALILFIPVCLVAQFDKKTLRLLEKQGVSVRGDTLKITGSTVSTNLNKDSVFGRTVVNREGGWNDYLVNLEGGLVGSNYVYNGVPWNNGYSYIQVLVSDHVISMYEVSNSQYRDFVSWTRIHQPENLQAVLPDTLAWRMPLAFNEPFVNYYFRHPAYNDYPMVNVSHRQAELYLEWLTAQYNQSPKRKYKKVRFRLPTEAEWMYDYLGGETQFAATHYHNFRRSDGKVSANFIIPVAGSQMRLQNNQRLTPSDSLLNRFGGVQNNNTATDPTRDIPYISNILVVPPYSLLSAHEKMITTSVESNWPNGFGLYNMAGNVSEYVSDKGISKGGHWNSTGFYLMPTSRETFPEGSGAAPTRGFRWVMEIIEE